MKHTLFFMIIAVPLALSALNVAQAQQTRPAAKSAYETLPDTDRRIVSAIYESQLGSRRDLAGHPLLSKDKIAAMRRSGGWDDVYDRLARDGSVAAPSLRAAMASYGQDTAPLNRSLIISTAAGDQIIVPRRLLRAAPPPPNPALVNIIPTKPVRRAQVQVQALPVLTASGEAAEAGAAIDPMSDGSVAPGIATSAAQSR